MTGADYTGIFRDICEFLAAHPWLKDEEASNNSYRLNLKCETGFCFENDDPNRMVFTGETLQRVLDLAAAGDRFAHEALCEIAQQLTDRLQPLPLDLQRYVVTLTVRPFTAKKGAHRVSAVHRNDGIYHAVEQAIASGLKLSRNREPKAGATETESACSLVSRALNACGIPVQESAVLAIWKQRRQARLNAQAAAAKLGATLQE